MQDNSQDCPCVQHDVSGADARLHERPERASEVRSAMRSCSLPVGRVSVMNSCSTVGVTTITMHSTSGLHATSGT